MRTRIHVNGQNLRANAKRISGKHPQGKRNAVFTAKNYKANRCGTRVEIDGPSQLVYHPEAPFRHAVAWIETKAPVRVYDDLGKEVQ